MEISAAPRHELNDHRTFMVQNIPKITIIPGDGIGPEVIDQARRVLDWFVKRHDLAIATEEVPYGIEAYRRYGAILPEVTRAAIEAADLVLFGATGGSEPTQIPADKQRTGSLLRIRRWHSVYAHLPLYANLRPIKALPALYEASPLKRRVLDGVDLIVVRELAGGIYFGEPRGIERLPNGERRAFNTQTYTSAEIRRIARFAFELARSRRAHVTSVDKANAMESGQLWREEVEALHAAEFNDVVLRHMYVDNCAMQLMRDPRQFDVIVTCNLFGDVLSDCAAMAAGSIGMLPSASFGPIENGRRRALYEPVHGSAPDIAGQDIANPLGAILSLAMAFRLSLDRAKDADLLEAAVTDALDRGARTRDIAAPGSSSVSCAEMGGAVLSSLQRLG
jgi:3-isopropylmalate dehydrogenase